MNEDDTGMKKPGPMTDEMRVSLGWALINSVPRDRATEILESLKHEPAMQIVDSTDMTPEELQQAVTPQPIRPATYAEVMDFASSSPLEIGDRVRWRAGYQNAEVPTDDQEVYVTALIDPPRFEIAKGEGNSVIERSDIAVAFMSPQGIFEFPYDSRRFERVEEAT